MGRSGGGRPSSSFRSGRSSGGRSFGGRSSRSGGSRASFGGFSSRSARPSGGGSVLRSGPIFFGGSSSSRRTSSARRASSSGATGAAGASGCGTAAVTIVIVVILLAVLWMFLSGPSDSGGGTQAAANTTERTPLSGQADKTDWITDEIGWITSERDAVEGMEDFYHQTGVQPHLLLVSYDERFWNGNDISDPEVEAYLETFYESTFTDEAHFVFAYFEREDDSKQEMEGHFDYSVGYAAETVMDSEALRIFWGYFEQSYYDTSLTIEEMVSQVFSNTAGSIMSRPTNAWDFAKIAVIVAALVAVCALVAAVIKIAAKRQKEKEEYTKAIIDMPLETFGDREEQEKLDALEEKYK